MPELNITPEQGNDTPEHQAAMVAKAEGKETPATPPADETPERPAWLPEKFATPEDMAKAYGELEKKQGAGSDDPENNTQNADAEEADEAAKAAVDAAGLDMEALGNKIAKQGDLDAEDYEALSKQGISKDMVNAYVAGQQAIAEKTVATMHESVGGEEAFNNLLEWAGENLDKAEIASFNKTIDNGSEADIKLALAGLNSRYKAEGGATPNLLGGKRGGTTSGDVFRSTAELTKAMSDPRYQRDPAYRADVIAKLDRSGVL